jgi:hypothetical protein
MSSEREREREKERKKERNEVGDQPMITVKFCQVSFYTWSNYVAKDIYKDV